MHKMLTKMLGVLVACLLLASHSACGNSSSTNYQLNYAAFDGGGGLAGSGSYNLNASALGTSLSAGNAASSSYGAVIGTALIDDDGDGLDNGVEQLVFNTNPNNADTDNDSLTDGEEVITFFTDPTLFDTDGDSFGDGEEVAGGWNPLDINSPIEFMENVPLPAWAVLMLGLILLVVVKRAVVIRS